MEGEVYTVTEMGLEMLFTLNADGTAESFDGELTETGTWALKDSAIIIGSGIEGMVPMTVNEDGTLLMEEDGVKLVFAKSDDASTETEAPTADVELTETPEIDVSARMADRMEIKCICTSTEVDGLTLQPSLLGDEYSLTFRADGTVDFVMVGMQISGLTWTLNDGTLLVDYYGTIMDATLTEEGFDLNYFDTMMLHRLPEA